MSNREIIFLVEGFILGIAVFFMALGCLDTWRDYKRRRGSEKAE